jgi:hypothetical protein
VKLLALPARVTENTWAAPGEGGRLVLHCDDAAVRAGDELLQVELIVNAHRDAPLQRFPDRKPDVAARVFGILVVELDPTTGRVLEAIPAEPFA